MWVWYCGLLANGIEESGKTLLLTTVNVKCMNVCTGNLVACQVPTTMKGVAA